MKIFDCIKKKWKNCEEEKDKKLRKEFEEELLNTKKEKKIFLNIQKMKRGLKVLRFMFYCALIMGGYYIPQLISKNKLLQTLTVIILVVLIALYEDWTDNLKEEIKQKREEAKERIKDDSTKKK